MVTVVTPLVMPGGGDGHQGRAGRVTDARRRGMACEAASRVRKVACLCLCLYLCLVYAARLVLVLWEQNNRDQEGMFRVVCPVQPGR